MLAGTVREARRKRGFSVLHLSKRSGVPTGVIWQIEGESPPYVPSEGNAALLTEALGIPVGSLITERDWLVEGLRHRPCEAAKEYRGVST